MPSSVTKTITIFSDFVVYLLLWTVFFTRDVVDYLHTFILNLLTYALVNIHTLATTFSKGWEKRWGSKDDVVTKFSNKSALPKPVYDVHFEY